MGTLRVVVVGAGIGGLTLALLLRQRGIVAEVVEQATELREVGAAIALSANGTRILDHLGVGQALEEVSYQPTGIVFRHGIDGHCIAGHPMGEGYRERFGGPFLGLHRVHLQRVLGDAWGSEHLHLGWRVEELEDRDGVVRIAAADGRRLDADVVVGADGVHSAIRRWVTGGETAIYSETSGFRGLVPVERLTSLPDPGAVQFWMGPDAHLLHYAIEGGSVINFLAVVEGPGRWSAPVWMEESPPGAHLAAFEGWHPAVLEMIGAAPQSPRWALFYRAALHHWHRGSVALIGDAAHAMLPHQGQGANQTIEDAAVLAGELAYCGPGEVSASLERYTDLRRARTRKLQYASWAASALLHLPDGEAARRRDARLARLPDELAWIHGYDALADGARETAPT